MDTKPPNQNDLAFPYWKMHSRAGNFNRRIELEDDRPIAWKSWGKSITENTKYLATFVEREGNRESNIFYSIWKYPFLRSKESLKKVFTKTREKWKDREYILLRELNNLRPSTYKNHSNLFEIVGLDETTRLNLYVSQSIQSENLKPENWNKTFKRAHLSFTRRKDKQLGRGYDPWDWCFRRIKRGFIGNHYGAWDTRFGVIRKIFVGWGKFENRKFI